MKMMSGVTTNIDKSLAESGLCVGGNFKVLAVFAALDGTNRKIPPDIIAIQKSAWPKLLNSAETESLFPLAQRCKATCTSM
jgi:hypothetical protein